MCGLGLLNGTSRCGEFRLRWNKTGSLWLDGIYRQLWDAGGVALGS
jgi:hypothetical protein